MAEDDHKVVGRGRDVGFLGRRAEQRGKLVIVVVMTSSIRAIAVQKSTKRIRQSMGMAAMRGTSRLRSIGVSDPPTTIQSRIIPSAMRKMARSFTLSELRMTRLRKLTRTKL